MANGGIPHPGFLRAGGQEGGFWQKIISFPSSAPWTWDSSSAPLQWTTFFFSPNFPWPNPLIRASQGNPPRITPRSCRGCGVFPSENQSSTEKEENNLPQAKEPGEAAFILDPSSVLPRKQTLGLRSREARAESLPQHLAHPSTRAGERSRACPTYLSLQLAHQVPVPPAGQPPFAGARWAAVRARARRRRRSLPVRAVPGRARGARLPAAAAAAARQAAVAAAGAKRAVSALPPLRRGHGKEGRGAGGRGGERGGAANGVQRLAPPACLPALPRPCARQDPASPCAQAACAHVRSASAGPWARFQRGAAVSVSPLGGLVRAQSGPGEHGLKVGVPLLGKPPTAALPQVRKDGQF